MKKITIAIDGHSSCGKSTMAKDLAQKIGYVYIDTGAMYRAVTLYAMRHGLISEGKVKAEALQEEMSHISISFQLNAETKRPDTYLNGEYVEREIRTMEVSHHVSQIAALPFVRTAMVEMQREMGKEKGVVMDGRDIGTVVLPNTPYKFYVTASAEVRAKRRFVEYQKKGILGDMTYEDVLYEVKTRDERDMNREFSPLRPAENAVIIDTSEMSIDEAVDAVIEDID